MIDLDAVIAAEVEGEPIEVQVTGKTFKLRPVMPWETAVHIANYDARAALESVFAISDVSDEGESEDDYTFADAVLADKPTLDQVTSRLKAIYATGESGASPRSSAKGGTRSRPTSKPTSTST